MADNLNARLDAIVEGLRRLRAADSRHLLFGAIGHRYQLRPPVNEAEIERFEQAHRVSLPAEYRAFLTRIGNGGAGPFYGILPLGEDGSGPLRVNESVGRIDQSFPHRAAWNWPEDRLQEMQDDESGELEAEYWRPVDGAVPIADQGCGLREWLAISGPEAGTVWHDATADYGGYRPWASGAMPVDQQCVTWSPIMIGGPAHYRTKELEQPRARLSFLDWYEHWLAHALAAVAN